MGDGETLAASLVSEFLGTYILVFTIGCNVLTGQSVWGGVSIACSLMVMIYALAKSSGANFNPAVSLALGVHGALPWKNVGLYMVVQLVGGICGGLSYLVLFGTSFHLGPAAGHTWLQAGVAELLYTFMLCFVVLNVAVSEKNKGNQYYGLAIGFVIVAGAYGAGGVSGGCFNPAVAWGIDVASTAIGGFKHCLMYTVFEFIGAILATVLFWVCRPDEPGCKLKLGAPGPLDGYPLHSKLVSEFIGTYMLILTVGLNVLGGSAAGAFSIAASLMCMIYALGSCSGAHFNPAVTLAIILSGREKCKPVDGAAYMVAQIVGGCCAAFTYCSLKSGQSFALKPAASTMYEALLAEFFFTFVLAFVVLSVATSKQVLTEYFGFAIGMCVTVGGFAIGKLSGGSLNPAVSIGITMSHQADMGAVVPYCIVELLAGAAAVGVYRVTQPSEFDKEVLP